jgi:sugar phosphate isomerase/epimerase
MNLSRRTFLGALAAHVSAGLALAGEKKEGKGPPLGVASSSYGIRMRAERHLRDPLAFLKFCRERGAGGVQLSVGMREKKELGEVRRYLESSGMFLEGSLRCPREKGDVARFAAEVHAGKEAGARVLRTVMLGSRRYETFRTLGEYRDFKARSERSLKLAEPVVAREKVTLAVENHKDFRADELAGLMRRIGSEHVGVCVDTGNNVALLEEPMETAKALAPWAVSAHLKDMGVREYAEGFLLSEVPFGEGFLDLKGIVGLLRKARPGIHFCLEMITRDPLKVPCLTEKYWATFPELGGVHLARVLRLVREKGSKKPLPTVHDLGPDERVKREDANARACLAYARERLGL